MTQKIVNPFRHQPHSHGPDGDHDHHDHDHDHDHGHGHDHDHGPEEQLDPAQQSLADALKVSFGVLKLIMLIMLVFYLFSNIFSVSPQEVAVRLSFGKIVGADSSAAVLKQGGPYLAWPYPFQQVLRIPTGPQRVELRKEFWWEILPNDPTGANPKMGPLNPEKDGALITGDKNVVHTQWSVDYTIADPVAYVTNVNDLKLAGQLVSTAAQEAVLFAIARLDADQVIRAQVSTDLAVIHIQRILDGMKTGLKIERLQMVQHAMPGPVKDAYSAVLAAESEKAKNIEEAQQEHDKIMGETAGEAHKGLWSLIREYDRVYAKTYGKSDAPLDETQIKALDAQLDEVFRDLRLPQKLGSTVVSGKVAEAINEAQNYRSSIVATLQAEANTFQSLYGVYKGNDAMRRIVIGRLTQDAREAIFNGDVETIRLPASSAKYLELSRDPLVNARRQEELLKQRRADRNSQTPR